VTSAVPPRIAALWFGSALSIVIDLPVWRDRPSTYLAHYKGFY
jgi:hypothetical protein